MPVIEPEPQPEVVEEVIANEPEPEAETVEEPAIAEPPVRSTGALLFISSGTVTDLKIYRMHRGDDVYVKRLKITSAGRQEIELENGSYKMTYLLQDGTEITQPFRIEGDYSTEVISK
jgi:Ser/Thr protein kinase RdoA (MazF antagonist)